MIPRKKLKMLDNLVKSLGFDIPIIIGYVKIKDHSVFEVILNSKKEGAKSGRYFLMSFNDSENSYYVFSENHTMTYRIQNNRIKILYTDKRK